MGFKNNNIINRTALALLLIMSPMLAISAQLDFTDVDRMSAIEKSKKFKRYVDSLSQLDNAQTDTSLLSSVLDVPEPTQNPNAKPKGVMVFVSLTMPNVALKQLLQQSKVLQIPLVIRGVLPQGFKGTLVRINKLLAQKNGDKLASGFAINPEWFKTFNIQSVPAFVTIKEGACMPKSPCMKDDFDILYGNISMYDALEILKKGDAGEIPTSILTRYEASL
ncbi:type-F conjugative transfer system pilin assembly protein TrbC [Moritella viscosa]|uniref:type-F conjugative transfer system pilin assembly protein TrbC n=1 Tax=Moritella viscosa TaxID=80854 RepID=UPI00091D32E8|nr:type-F conjugative transfer system pilin assembly protein TrbC [Moritella viscosa]SGZ09553.1 Putative uncharacterized protein [Moritella viscosa]